MYGQEGMKYLNKHERIPIHSTLPELLFVLIESICHQVTRTSTNICHDYYVRKDHYSLTLWSQPSRLQPWYIPLLGSASLVSFTVGTSQTPAISVAAFARKAQHHVLIATSNRFIPAATLRWKEEEGVGLRR